jgi:L-cysteine S-thiosulfotransferase
MARFGGRVAAIAGAALLSGAITVLAVVAGERDIQVAQAPSADAGSHRSEPVREFEREGKRSGYLFATPETRAMQDDDFDNPAFLWVERGERLWTTVAGTANRSCQSCHGPAERMRGIGNTYPRVNRETGRLFALEHQVNYCRTERMGAPEFAWESDDMLGISVFVMHQSRGLPINVAIDGPARPFYEEGERLYSTRRGQLNAACVHCHEYNSGNSLRADLLSEGRATGFPLYRLKWQRLGSFHYRMEECYSQVRARPEPYGSPELTALQLFVAWRSNGLLVETPAVRR